MKLANANKELAKNATARLKEEQERNKKMLKEKDRAWGNKVKELESELEAIKSKSNGKTERFYNDLRTQLMEEIERLEEKYKEQEENFVAGTSNKQLEIDSLKRSLDEAKNQRVDIEFRYKKKIQELTQKKESEINTLRQMILQEKERSEKYLNELDESNNELRVTHIESRVKEKVQAETKVDKEKTVDKMKQVEDLAKEKIAERNDMLKAKELYLAEEIKILEQKYCTALNEKHETEMQIKRHVEVAKPKFERLQAQYSNFQRAVGTLLTSGEGKVNHMEALVEELSNVLTELQKGFDQRESNLSNTCKKVIEERETAKTIIESANKDLKNLKVPEDFKDLHELQIKELDFIKKQLKVVVEEVNELQEKEAEGIKGSRQQLCGTLNRVNNFMNESKKNTDKLKIDIQNLLNGIKESDEVHISEEEISSTQIQTLNSELKKVKQEIKVLSTSDYVTRTEELKLAVGKEQKELDDTKKSLLKHIEKINTLEDKIKLKVDSKNFDKDDGIVKIKMENIKLNAENATSLNKKQEMEAHYEDQIQKLNEKYMKRVEDYDNVLTKYNNLTEARSKKVIEELKAWRNRAENLYGMVKKLGESIVKLNSRNQEISKPTNQDTKLYMEENKQLKKELDEIDKVWKPKEQLWKQEKDLMNIEINSLRTQINEAQDGLEQVNELLKDKTQVVKEYTNNLKAAEQLYKVVTEELKQSTDLILEWINKEEKTVQKSEGGPLQRLKNHLKEITSNIEECNREHAREIAALNAEYQVKIETFTEQKDNVLLETEALKTQLNGYKEEVNKLLRADEIDSKPKKTKLELLREQGNATVSSEQRASPIKTKFKSPKNHANKI